MKLSIIYAPSAHITANAIYESILNKFGLTAANKFVAKSEKTIELIAVNPLMFKATVIDETVRVALITKQCSLFYHVSDTSIQLLYFWDNRQDPQFDQY